MAVMTAVTSTEEDVFRVGPAYKMELKQRVLKELDAMHDISLGNIVD